MIACVRIKRRDGSDNVERKGIQEAKEEDCKRCSKEPAAACDDQM